MSITRTLSAVLLAIAITAPAHAQDNPIAKRMEAFAKAYNAGDANAVSSFYTDKGALLPPRSKALIGRKSIAAHYAQAFQGGATGLTYKILEISQAGPATAIEIGETEVKVGAQKIYGRYLHVWKKVNDTWSLSRDMYHVLGVVK